MHIRVFIFVVLLCMLQTCEIESHEFLKNAYKSVKSKIKNVASKVHGFFSSDDGHTEEIREENKVDMNTIKEDKETDVTTPYEPVIDIRFQTNDKIEDADEPILLPLQDEPDSKIPDIHSRHFIDAPCGAGSKKSNNGACRQIVN